MRRLVTSSCAATLLLAGGLVVGSQVGTAGQPETMPSTEPAGVTTEVGMTTEAAAATETSAATEAPAAMEDHPLVGLWSAIADDDPEAPPLLLAFSPHGIVQSVEGGSSSLGVWEATGPTSGAMTLVLQSSGEEEGESEERATLRATFDVDSDGQSLTAEYTIEFVGEGVPAGEFGPGTATGTRIVVEPMGTPAGSLEDLFGAFEEGADVSSPPPDSSEPGTSGPGSSGPPETGPDANVERYCALVQELDEAGADAFAELEADESATDEDFAAAERQFIEDHQDKFDELRDIAPEEIANDVDVLLAAQEQRAAGGEQEDVAPEVAAAEERIGAFEDEHCTTSN